MNQVPNFAKVDFRDTAVPSGTGSAAPWTTPEGVAVKPVYGERDLAGLDFTNAAGESLIGLAQADRLAHGILVRD